MKGPPKKSREIVQIYFIFVKNLIWDLEERKVAVLQEKEKFV
jgi:hypothetical protein